MNSGAYQLTIEIKKDIKIKIGALGRSSFRKGFYVYTGSAMTGLEARVARHKRKDKKIRWHIDYLLNHRSVKIIDVKLFRSINKQECSLNLQVTDLPDSEIPVPKFGSSDCRVCPAHLVKVKGSFYEEIMSELAFERMIDRGLKDSRDSNVISNE